MEFIIGEILILAIASVIGFIAFKIFRPSKKISVAAPLRKLKQNSLYTDSCDTERCSGWNVSVLSKDGESVIKKAPVYLSHDRDFTIGRDKKSTLVINDKTVSLYHAYLTQDDEGNLTLNDADSLNGIVCNENGHEREYTELPVKDGTICYLGNVPVAFSRSGSRRLYSRGAAAAEVSVTPHEAVTQKYQRPIKKKSADSC